MTPDEIARTMPEWPETGDYTMPTQMSGIAPRRMGLINGYVLFVSDMGAVLDNDYNYESSPLAVVHRQKRNVSFHDDDEFGLDYNAIMDAAIDARYSRNVDIDEMKRLLSLVGIQPRDPILQY